MLTFPVIGKAKQVQTVSVYFSTKYLAYSVLFQLQEGAGFACLCLQQHECISHRVSKALGTQSRRSINWFIKVSRFGLDWTTLVLLQCSFAQLRTCLSAFWVLFLVLMGNLLTITQIWVMRFIVADFLGCNLVMQGYNTFIWEACRTPLPWLSLT